MTALSIPDQPTYAAFDVGAGGQTVFPISFSVFAKADLRVLVGSVELPQSGFSFAGNVVDGGFAGGNVTLNVAAVSAHVVIWRDVAPIRTTNFQPSAFVRVPDVDSAYNRLHALAQDTDRDFGRTLLAPPDGRGGDIPDIASLEGKALGVKDGKYVGVSLVVGVETLSFATWTAAAAATIAGSADFIRVAGYATVGDGGDCTFGRAGAATLFQTADGAYWQPAGKVISTRQIGVFPSVSSCRVAVQAALDLLETRRGTLIVDDLASDLLLDFTGAHPNKYALAHPDNVNIYPRFPGCGFKVMNDAGDYRVVIQGKTGTTSHTDCSGLTIDQNATGNTTADVKVGGNGPAFAVFYSATNNRADRMVILNAPGINTICINGAYMTGASACDNEVHFVQGHTTAVGGFYDNSAIYMDGKNYDCLRNRVFNDGAKGLARCGIECHGANYRYGANTVYGYVLIGNVVGENVPSASNGFRPVQASCNIELYDNVGIDVRGGWQLWALDGAHLKGIRTRRNKAYRNPGLFPATVDTHFCIGYHYDYVEAGDFEEDAADNVDVCVPYQDATAADASAGFMRMSYGNITLKSTHELANGSPNSGHSVMAGAGLTAGNLPAWDGVTAYQLLQRRSHGGADYECILAHTNQAPPNATYWKPIDPATNVARINFRSPRSIDVGQNALAGIRYHGILRGICIGEVVDAQIEDTGTGSGLTGVINGWAGGAFLVNGSDVTFPPAVSRVANSAGQRHISQYHSTRNRDHAVQTLIQGATTVALVLYGGVREFHVPLSATACQFVKDPAVDPAPPGFEFLIHAIATAATSTVTFSADFKQSGWVDFTGIGQTQTARFRWTGTVNEQITPWLKM